MVSRTTPETTTVKVSHLGGITVGYRLSSLTIDPAKPTVVLVNSMCTTVALYDPQFSSSALLNAVNLLAIEPLGHGATVAHNSEHFTFWDSAIMTLQAMDALGVDQAFALGTSAGGWIVVRMALLAPDRVRDCPVPYLSSMSKFMSIQAPPNHVP
jgi:pimeloyl-ACP methyl ester carboxylesterase